jgi:hypothetical protein
MVHERARSLWPIAVEIVRPLTKKPRDASGDLDVIRYWYSPCCRSRIEEDAMPEDRESERQKNQNEEDLVGRADERDDEEEFEDIEEADDEEDLES